MALLKAQGMYYIFFFEKCISVNNRYKTFHLNDYKRKVSADIKSRKDAIESIIYDCKLK